MFLTYGSRTLSSIYLSLSPSACLFSSPLSLQFSLCTIFYVLFSLSLSLSFSSFPAALTPPSSNRRHYPLTFHLALPCLALRVWSLPGSPFPFKLPLDIEFTVIYLRSLFIRTRVSHMRHLSSTTTFASHDVNKQCINMHECMITLFGHPGLVMCLCLKGLSWLGYSGFCGCYACSSIVAPASLGNMQQ